MVETVETKRIDTKRIEMNTSYRHHCLPWAEEPSEKKEDLGNTDYLTTPFRHYHKPLILYKGSHLPVKGSRK
jgi:hypothetical protein